MDKPVTMEEMTETLDAHGNRVLLPTSEVLKIGLSEIQRRQKIAAAKTGKPRSEDAKQSIAEGMRKSWDERRAEESE